MKLYFITTLITLGIVGITTFVTHKNIEPANDLVLMNVEALSSSEGIYYETMLIDSMSVWDYDENCWRVVNICSCIGKGNLDCSTSMC